jgi:hypothetical protein
MKNDRRATCAVPMLLGALGCSSSGAQSRIDAAPVLDAPVLDASASAEDAAQRPRDAAVQPDVPPIDGPHPTLVPGEWVVLNPGTYCMTLPGAYGIAVSPSNLSTLYLSSCGLHRSDDGGQTWRELGDLDSVNHVRIDPRDPDHFYASDGVNGGTMGFWVSTDGGRTLYQPDGFLEHANNGPGGWTADVYDIAADPADFNHVLVSFHSPFEGSDRSGIIESTDGGSTWRRHFPIADAYGAGWGIWFLSKPSLGIGDSSTWLLGVQASGYWRTHDAGQSWTKVSDNAMEHGGGQIYYTASGTLYATGVPSMLRSTDNGVTWTNVGPFAGHIGIVGDGERLYVKSHDRTDPIMTATESTGDDWAPFEPNPPAFFGGAYELAYDPVNRIVYGAFLSAGLMALKLP